MKKPQRIVLATDFSPACDDATDYAVLLTKKMGLTLEVLHVFDTKLVKTPLPYYPAGEAWVAEYIRKNKQNAEKRLQKLCKELDVACKPRFTEGTAAKKIVEFVGENDILIVGSHGYTGFDRFLMGSVSEYSLRYASCPVLVVRQKQPCKDK